MTRKDKPLDVPLRSVAIERIIEEIRIEQEAGTPRGYNRVYSRHNRS